MMSPERVRTFLARDPRDSDFLLPMRLRLFDGLA